MLLHFQESTIFAFKSRKFKIFTAKFSITALHIDHEAAGDDDDEDDFDGKFEADSDIEDGNDDSIPDSRAWGSKRRNFYSTDFVDADYSSYNTKEQELAEQEETEARAIQQRLAKQLEESDFALDIFGEEDQPKKDDKTKSHEIYMQKDLSALSTRQKDQLFKKDSPEFHGLIGDFRTHLTESTELLDPILKHFKDNEDALTHPLLQVVAHRNQLILNYCSNISFYLVLKAQRMPIKHHPIVKRLFKFRQLILQMEEKFTTVFRPQLERLAEAINSGKEFTIAGDEVPQVKKTKKLRFLDTMQGDATVSTKSKKVIGEDDEDVELEQKLAALAEASDDENPEGEGKNDEVVEDDDGRRQITYQIAKNKGLTPYRKKELRNPRVKNKLKYRKAVIRRKGQVRQVYKQDKRYESEKFGINARVKKGIKIQ